VKSPIRLDIRDPSLVDMERFSITHLVIPDVVVVQPRKFGDYRGYFVETFSRRDFEKLGIANDFVQDNQSFSARRGTVRGLHFQVPPHPQAKLVRVLRGAVYDVAIDLRRSSPTYGRWCGTTLTAQEGNQLFVPRGFAHAFCTLEPDTEVAYKVDDYYAPECDAGLIWDDPDLGIDWPIPAGEAVLSEKDAKLPRLADFQSPFIYAERK
jgi:dTDP-4-dehydrorhamnose 3,5-epimerase